MLYWPDYAPTRSPVIFVTALSESVDEQRGLELGAADCISKPIQQMLVLSSVRVQLEA